MKLAKVHRITKSKDELNDRRAVLRNKRWDARAAESVRMNTAQSTKKAERHIVGNMKLKASMAYKA